MLDYNLKYDGKYDYQWQIDLLWSIYFNKVLRHCLMLYVMEVYVEYFKGYDNCTYNW